MARRARLTSLLLACASLAVPAIAAADGARLGRGVVPVAQSVRLTLDAAQHEYSGSVRIEVEARAAADSFQLNLRGEQLGRVVLSGARGAIPSTATPAAHDRLTIRPERRLAPGRYTLEIEFTNAFDTHATSLYRLETGGDAYAFSQFESDDARGAFPCWDEPEFKIPWRVTLVVPAAHLAIANTPIERETTVSGMKTVEFKVTKPLPAYLLAIATGPLETVPIPGMSVPGRVVTVKGASGLAAEVVRQTPPLLAALERYFGRPYPYEKLDLLAVPEFLYGAMENAGAITFADRILLLDPRATSVQQRRRLAEINAHELAHMWFGDLVTMEWWDDLWLNESFASWLGDKVTQEVYPEFDTAVRELEGTARALETDVHLSTRAIRQPVDENVNLDQMADELAYQKGQSVLGMFEQWLGPEVFRKGVLAYLDAHAWGNARGSDLWNALSKASGRDVGAALSTFLDRSGVPLVSTELLPGGRVRLSQRRFLTYGAAAPAPQLWQIPVVLKLSSAGRLTTQRVLLTESRQVFTLEARGAVDWVHPNADERGYYRWSLPSRELAQLASAAPGALNERERIGLLSDLGALLEAGEVHADDYLRTVARMRDDPSPAVVQAVAGAIERIRLPFVTNQLRDPFASYVRETLGPAFRRVGWEKGADEPPTATALRADLVGALGDEGRDPDVIARSAAMGRDYLRDPASVDASLQDVVLRLAALHGDAALYDQIQKRFETAQVPTERARFLSTLGWFRDDALVDRTLAYALAGPLRPQELRFVLPGISRDPRLAGRLFEWMKVNYAAITGRVPPQMAALMPFYASGCSAERLESARVFFSEPAHAAVGTQQTLSKVADRVNDCVGLREREGAAAARYLSEAAAAK